MKNKIKPGAVTETTFYILLSLYNKNHGYGIMQFVEKETNGRVIMGPGTLYGAINNLLEKKLIEPINQYEGNRRKEYIITEEGKGLVHNELKRLEDVYRTAIKIVKGDMDND